MDYDRVVEGVRDKNLFSGIIRVHKGDRHDAYVSVDGLSQDIRTSSLKFQVILSSH